jgi:Tol biopolymer transport system component
MRLLLKALVPFLIGLIVTVPIHAAADEKAPDIEKLIRQLGDEDFDVREETTAKLAKLGEAVLPALKTAAKESHDVEVKRRAAELVARIEKENRADQLTIRGPTSGYWLNRVTFSKDGKQAIATGGGVIWYDLESGKEVNRTLEKQYARPGLALSKDGQYFATGHQNDNDVHLGDVAKGKDAGICKGHTAGVWAVAFSPDGSQIVSGSDDKTMRLWEFKTVKEVRQFDHGKYRVRAVAFSPDGKQIASGTAGDGESFPVYLWDAESGKKVQTFKGHQRDVTAVLFTPDGKRLLTAGLDGLLIVWDVESGKELKRMGKGVGSGVFYHAALSPDGKRALTAGYTDRVVRLWDVEKGTEIKKFEGHPGAVLGVAFSPDGKRALSSDSQDTIKLWKLPQ